jgi:predicted dehydrogenase
VYTEKPLATDLDEAKALLDLAAERGLHMTSAPDTYLGAGIQTAHKLLTDGWIGRPFGATAHLTRIPPETWHPDPAFLYHTGAGPLYDSGPYFVAALAYLLGPVVHVMSAAGKTWDTRLITSEPHYGETITVEVPTFVTALLTFASGAIATVLLTTDVPYSRLQDPRQHGHSIELYGTNGTLSVPSPCYFDGLLYYRTAVLEDWAELPTLFTFRDDCRGVGVADLAAAVLTGRPPRVSAALAYHVTEVLQRIEEAGQTRTTRAVESTFERTAPLDPWLRPGEVDPA